VTRWQWVRQDVALAIHSEQLREHGGSSGLRDLGLLLSALAHPQNLAAYGAPDVAALAAGYAQAIVTNHPFVDGNKRTAYVVCELFLALNGHFLTADDADGVINFLALASGDLSEAQLANWLRSNINPA
jgi:death-on-curing protein